MNENPYQPPEHPTHRSWWSVSQTHKGIVAVATQLLATVAFFFGLFMNNVTFITDDYTNIVLTAASAFLVTLLVAVASFRIQHPFVRIWYVMMGIVCIQQLVDAIGRRLLHWIS